jgi:hypothetical protein
MIHTRKSAANAFSADPVFEGQVTPVYADDYTIPEQCDHAIFRFRV